MTQNSAEQKNGLPLRERIIAELSFTLLDMPADSVTIGDVRAIADRIVALVAEPTLCDAKRHEPWCSSTHPCAYNDSPPSTVHRKGDI